VSTADVTLRIDDDQLRRWIRAALPEARQGAASALTKTARTIAGRTVKGAAMQVSVQPKRIRRRVKVMPATRNRLSARTRVYVKSLNPMMLKAREVGGRGGASGRQRDASGRFKKGARRPRRGGGVKAYGGRSWPHAFIAKGIQGRPKVMQRKALGNPASLPVSGLRVPWAAEARGVFEKVVARASQVMFDKTLPHEIMWRLRRAGSR